MRCSDIDRLASTYIDGELDEARASALRGHMRSCERCADHVADLATIRDTAARLDPVDAPPEFWSRIEAGLAEAEVVDANRSSLWLRWHSIRHTIRHAIRPMLLPGAVVVSAAAVLVLWLVEPGTRSAPPPGEPQTTELAESGSAAGATGSDPGYQPMAAVVIAAAPGQNPGDVDEFSAARTAEVLAADQEYMDNLDELRQLVVEERSSWPDELARVFDRRMAEFDELVRDERTSLARKQAIRPESRDRLYAIYRAQIAFLQGVVIDGTVSDGAIAQVMRPAGGFSGEYGDEMNGEVP